MRNFLTTLMIGLLLALGALTGAAVVGVLLSFLLVMLFILIVGKLLSAVFGPLRGRP